MTKTTQIQASDVQFLLSNHVAMLALFLGNAESMRECVRVIVEDARFWDGLSAYVAAHKAMQPEEIQPIEADSVQIKTA